jgi:hypothetical protein
MCDQFSAPAIVKANLARISNLEDLEKLPEIKDLSERGNLKFSTQKNPTTGLVEL